MAESSPSNESSLNVVSSPTQRAMSMALWTFDLDEAVQYINKDFEVRKFDEILKNVIRERAKKTGESEADLLKTLKKELGGQNLSNWTTGAVRISRGSVIKIAFFFQMTYEETEAFLKACWLDGFYMRDVKDVIYRYALENGWKFSEAEKMINKFASTDYENSDPKVKGTVQKNVTEFLRSELCLAQTKKELEKKINHNKHLFGSFRRRTYEYFMKLYGQVEDGLFKANTIDLLSSFSRNENARANIKFDLKKSEEGKKLAGYDRKIDEVVERKLKKTISQTDICDLVLLGIPKIKNGILNKTLRELLTEHINTRSTLSEIINKIEQKGNIVQVDRKYFILFWLASDNGNIDNFINNNYEDELNFKEHYRTLNKVLETYGMAALDPRHPFDWIIINSMRYGHNKNKNKDWLYDMVGRMQAIIDNLQAKEMVKT